MLRTILAEGHIVVGEFMIDEKKINLISRNVCLILL